MFRRILYLISYVDISLFTLTKGSSFTALLIYVDDILIIGSDKDTIKSIKQQLDFKFSNKDLGSLHYYIGIEILQNLTKLVMSQKKYALDFLQCANMLNHKPSTIPLDPIKTLNSRYGKPLDDPSLYRNDWAACPITRRLVSRYAVFLGPCLISWTFKKQLVDEDEEDEAELVFPYEAELIFPYEAEGSPYPLPLASHDVEPETNIVGHVPRAIRERKAVKKMVKKRIAEAIAEYEKTRANPDNAEDLDQLILKDLGVVGLTRWLEKIEQDYNNRFHDLALMCPNLVTPKKKKIERYIRGLSDRVNANVTSSKPVSLHDTINMARELVEQAIQGKAARIGESNKKKWLRTIPMEFAVVKSHSPYNVIFGRTGLRSLGAVALTIHSMIKFPTSNGIATMKTKKETLRECRRIKEAQGPILEGRITFPRIQAPNSKGMANKGSEEDRGQMDKAREPDDVIQPPPIPPKKDTRTDKNEGKDESLENSIGSKPLEKVVIHNDYLDQTITIRGNLSAECKSILVEMLCKHADAFTWTPAYMTRIPRFIAEHELKTYPHIEPRVQRKRSIALDRRKAMPTRGTTKYKWLKRMKRTAFPTDEGVFCYTKVPFRLKNTEATYQRLVDTIFEGKMGRNLEAYVDDMVIKSKTELKMIKDGEQTLLTLKKIPLQSSGKGPTMPRHTKNYTNKKDFHWTTEAEEAFQAMKKLITELPTLMAPKKEEELMVYLSVANEAISISHILREENRKSDTLSKLAAVQCEGLTKGVLIEGINERSVDTAEVNAIIKEATTTWMTPIQVYIDHGILLEYATEISHILREENRKSDTLSKLAAVQCEGLTKGVLIEELNERSVDTAEVNAIIKEATTTWMTPIQVYIDHGILLEYATEDANDKTSSCDSCQMHATILKLPENDMIFVTLAWPFQKIPATIMIDNETQLINDPFKSWEERLGIKLVSTSPQANRAVQRANQSIIQGIKTKMHQEGGSWVEELPNVIWAHRTTPKTSNVETPFSLSYGTEAVIPAEIGILTRRKI
nr:reverse transcriptase domain-containing protein [Tanacetum cinerariifolium]